MILDTVDLTEIGPLGPLKRKLSNWVKTADVLYNEDIAEHDILVMLKLELTTHKREYIISRLYSRFNKLRAIREKQELKEWNQKKQLNDTLNDK